jgi:hypothetical protein
VKTVELLTSAAFLICCAYLSLLKMCMQKLTQPYASSLAAHIQLADRDDRWYADRAANSDDMFEEPPAPEAGPAQVWDQYHGPRTKQCEAVVG